MKDNFLFMYDPTVSYDYNINTNLPVNNESINKAALNIASQQSTNQQSTSQQPVSSLSSINTSIDQSLPNILNRNNSTLSYFDEIFHNINTCKCTRINNDELIETFNESNYSIYLSIDTCILIVFIIIQIIIIIILFVKINYKS